MFFRKRQSPALALKTCGILGILALPLHAVVVTTATDEDNGNLTGTNGTGVSLREAVKYTPAGSTISFDPSLSGSLLRLTIAPLLISRSLTIDASGLPQRVTISGDRTGNGGPPDAGDVPVFNVELGTVVLDSLVITGGYYLSGGGGINAGNGQLTVRNCSFTGNRGGGISAGSGKLTVQDCSFSGNISTTGAAIRNLGTTIIEDSTFTGNQAVGRGGALYIHNHVTLRGSTFTGNTAGDDGGAVYTYNPVPSLIEDCAFSGNISEGDGGAIYSQSELTLKTSVFSSNSCEGNGGGLVNRSNKPLTVESTTFSGNSSADLGGGVYVTGWAIISSSTFVRNSAWEGGGIHGGTDPLVVNRSTLFGNSAGRLGGAIRCALQTEVTATTIFGNSAIEGGGIGYYADMLLTLRNSIVTGNPSELSPELFEDYVGSHNLTSGNPRLAPLGDYGGPTHTMPPMPDSPAIDGGVATDLTSDQRGFPFVGTPDIGAAEYQGRSDLARLWNVDPDNDGIPHGVEQATGTDSFVPNPSPLSGPTLLDEGGGLSLVFPLAPAAEPGTRLAVSRSPDLTPDSFQSIYQFNGIADTTASGITFTRTTDRITVTDTNPPTGQAFYSLEAILDPPPEP